MSKPQAPTVIATTVEEPIRAELFSVERLEQHAESLAAAQEVVDAESSPGHPLLPQVIENGRRLLEYYRATARAVELEQGITPAASGCSIIFTSSKNSSAKFATTCRLVSTASSPNLCPAISRDIRGSTELPGRTSPTPIVGSIRKCFAAS